MTDHQTAPRARPSHRTDSRGVVLVLDRERYLAHALRLGRDARRDLATCEDCGRTWDDGIVTSWTPAPSARCPYEGMGAYRGGRQP